MRKVLFFLGIFATSISNAESVCPIVGKWRSDETKTLESMRQYGNVTEKQRKLFESDFFGKLTVEIDCDKFTTTFDGEVEIVEYEVVSIEGNKITTRYVESFTGEIIESTAAIENEECYSVPVRNLGFKEYFCRIE